jgi:hypothetical protein
MILCQEVYSQYVDSFCRYKDRFPQTKERIDSLKKITETENPDTLKVWNLCLLSHLYAYYRSDSSIFYSRKALELSERLKNSFCKVLAYKFLGDSFYALKNYDSSTLYLQRGLELCAANHLFIDELSAFRPPLNNNFFLEGNYTAAMKISADGLTTAEKFQ